MTQPRTNKAWLLESLTAFLRSFGEWLGRKVDSESDNCWHNLLIMGNGDASVRDFYDELETFLVSVGYAGLDDETLDLSEWSRRAG